MFLLTTMLIITSNDCIKLHLNHFGPSNAFRAPDTREMPWLKVWYYKNCREYKKFFNL